MNPRVFVSHPVSVGMTMEVSGEDGHHFARVLRVEVGEPMAVASGGRGYLGTVTAVDAKQGRLSIAVEAELPSHEPEVRVYLVQALAKGDKIDFILQHNTEVGAAGFLLLPTSRSIVRLDDKKRASKLERWSKVVQEAASQSQRDVVPPVEFAADVAAALDWVRERHPLCVLFLDESSDGTIGLATAVDRCTDAAQRTEGVALVVVVGPEGGWTDEERDLWMRGCAAIRTSLGLRTLRTETAGLAATAAVLHHYRQLGG
ncbi:ribosomal RNA small subunit methyltransferase E [Alicyclobacillus contaminans]|uniref:RsmE family RNA methyltransferase n=1 Tax=Alicyclobacillus contaminans TaxID=392016 RepID=UPI000429ED28|nr:16S rRNA (uracil(1498)-N(3))-methyltransferase [Alicyclobacillus contaminans]GMA52148.1 ribosomal RNA small subunit methyltransferase E [Alicyclobacillus contaminans]